MDSTTTGLAGLVDQQKSTRNNHRNNTGEWLPGDGYKHTPTTPLELGTTPFGSFVSNSGNKKEITTFGLLTLHAIQEGQIDEHTITALSQFVDLQRQLCPPHLPQKLQEALGHALHSLSAGTFKSSTFSVLLQVLTCLTRLNAESDVLRRIVEARLLPEIPTMDLKCCVLLLQLKMALKIGNSQIDWFLLDRIAKQLDALTREDAATLLRIFATYDTTHHNILKQCQEHLQQQCTGYKTDDLLKAMKALAQLHWRIPKQAYQELSDRRHLMTDAQRSRFLKLFTLRRSFHPRQVNEVIDLVYDKKQPSLSEKAAIAYSICSYQLHERKSLLAACLEDLMQPGHEYSPDDLVRLTEVLQYLDYKGVELHPPVRPSIHYIAKRDKLYQETQRTKSEAAFLQRLLTESATRKYCFEAGVDVGPFKPTLVDGTKRLAIVLETACTPTDATLQRHIYGALCFRRIGIQRRKLYSVKTDADKVSFLEAHIETPIWRYEGGLQTCCR